MASRRRRVRGRLRRRGVAARRRTLRPLPPPRRTAHRVQLQLPRLPVGSGSVYVYQGQELGLPEADIPLDRIQDPMHLRSGGTDPGRDGCRVPLPWAAAEPHCGSGSQTPPWLPQPADWPFCAADHQAADPHSMLTLYRRAIALRRTTPGFGDGTRRAGTDAHSVPGSDGADGEGLRTTARQRRAGALGTPGSAGPGAGQGPDGGGAAAVDDRLDHREDSALRGGGESPAGSRAVSDAFTGVIPSGGRPATPPTPPHPRPPAAAWDCPGSSGSPGPPCP